MERPQEAATRLGWTINTPCLFVREALGWLNPQILQFAFESWSWKKTDQSLKGPGEQNLEKLAGIMRGRSGKGKFPSVLSRLAQRETAPGFFWGE